MSHPARILYFDAAALVDVARAAIAAELSCETEETKVAIGSEATCSSSVV
jgi:hypothetical protein